MLQFSHFIAAMAATINIKSDGIDVILIPVNAPIAGGKIPIIQFPIEIAPLAGEYKNSLYDNL